MRLDAMEPTGLRSDPASELVSVVLNFLNAQRFIEESIASVYEQSHRDWELLLIDDGSTDRSTTIAKYHAAANPTRVRYLEHPGHQNKGASAARNLGISQARGALVAFLDSDDVWLPQRLERAVELFRRNPAAEMIYGKSEYWTSWSGAEAAPPDREQEHGFLANRIVPAPELLIRHLTHTAALPCMNSITVRKEAALACGGFVESFPGMHDDQAFLACFCLYHDVYVSDECWDRYRQHPWSLSAGAAQRGEVDQRQQVFIAWLRGFLSQGRMGGTRVWDALRYAELVQRYSAPGLRNKLSRHALRRLTLARMALRPRIRTSKPSASFTSS
jgi:glycosyltransferase involved in cell wall biosynthesis